MMFIDSILGTDNMKGFWFVSALRAWSRDSFLSLELSHWKILASSSKGAKKWLQTLQPSLLP